MIREMPPSARKSSGARSRIFTSEVKVERDRRVRRVGSTVFAACPAVAPFL
jgi:hypothetical protein